jgi:hypothetical protein
MYQGSSDRRWLSVVDMSSHVESRRLRKAVSARTCAEVVDKVKVRQRQGDGGLQALNAQLTVGQLRDRWYSDVLHQVVSNAADNYTSIADNHIRPSLGRKKVAKLTPADVDRQEILGGVPDRSAFARSRHLVPVPSSRRSTQRTSSQRSNVCLATGDRDHDRASDCRSV